MSYVCPICENELEINAERTGPAGFRVTDYSIQNKTCNCITYECDVIAMAIKSYKNEKLIEKDDCEECKVEKATVHYPVKPWAGEYKDICSYCFKKEMENLKEQFAK